MTTHPIKILVLPDSDPLNYMGIGFDRNSTKRDDYFNSPADNAFLNITDETEKASNTKQLLGATVAASSCPCGPLVLSTARFISSISRARLPKFSRSRMMRDWRVAPARSTMMLSSRRPARSGASRTGWHQ